MLWLQKQQALFRRQLQSLRDRLNLTTASLPAWSSSYSSRFDPTQLAPYTTTLSSSSGLNSIHESRRPTSLPNSTTIQESEHSNSNSSSSSNQIPVDNARSASILLANGLIQTPAPAPCSQQEKQNKLWEIILQAEPHLGEGKAKELAQKYVSALE